MLILGIDPGTAVTGYGVVRTGAPHLLVECGVIRTKADRPLPSRLKDISDGVRELLARHRPDAMAVEDVFYARNVRTTIVLGHARGTRRERVGERLPHRARERGRHAVGRVGGLGSALQSQQLGDHELHLGLGRVARARDRLLDLGRRVLVDRDARLLAGEEDHAARMAEHDRRAHVARVEDCLLYTSPSPRD